MAGEVTCGAGNGRANWLSTFVVHSMVPSRIRALVVDDDRPTCDLVQQILQRAGYEVTTAAQPDEVAHVASRGDHFEVAVLDVVMPVLTGEKLAQRVRVRNPDLKVLFLTGFSDVLFKAQPTLWEGEAFLEKPCTDRGLIEALALLLTGRLPEGWRTAAPHDGIGFQREPGTRT